jgi:hypothetical protein
MIEESLKTDVHIDELVYNTATCFSLALILSLPLLRLVDNYGGKQE